MGSFRSQLPNFVNEVVRMNNCKQKAFTSSTMKTLGEDVENFFKQSSKDYFFICQNIIFDGNEYHSLVIYSDLN